MIVDNLRDNICNFFFRLKRNIEKEQAAQIVYLEEAIYAFLQDETTQNAYDVYTVFFDIYKMKSKDGKSFVDLLDTLLTYEEQVAVINEKQRDHYIHSVNVFLLGIGIYSGNANIGGYFTEWLQRPDEKRICPTVQEEFLLRWGIASLFHDIGYPVEIISNQLKGFIRFISGGAEQEKEIRPYVDYISFEKLNNIDLGDETVISAENQTEYLRKFVEMGWKKPTDLIAAKLAYDYRIDFKKIRAMIDEYLSKMQRNGFVDHGFYSAIIILKWYGEMLEKADGNVQPISMLYFTVLDAAESILLHNYYEKTLMRELGRKMSAKEQPLAYLLAFCDASQEWNRKAYGAVDKMKIGVDNSKVQIGAQSVEFEYDTYKGSINDKFIEKKNTLFCTLFKMDDVFPKGVCVIATTRVEKFAKQLRAEYSSPHARPLIDNIELIAKSNHEYYLKQQQENEKKTGRAAVLQSWEDLPDEKKYSNFRVAMSIFRKLHMIGCTTEPNGTEPLECFDEDEIELLAEFEHEQWMQEKRENGWIYGNEKDEERKTTPYLCPYDELDELTKNYDRATVKMIIPVLKQIGMSVFRME